ncbi:MMPL family transporter [Zunongwangia sp.]|uniref:MMPL family transporter n=1 Tax=Zunongwangia sp. TaxID=1965325 RepID=UPI003AA827B2
MHQFFLASYQYFQRHKIFGVVLLVFFAAVMVFTASNVRFEEDVTGLIPSGEDQAVLKRILKETEFSDKIIVCISSEEENLEKLTQYANQFIDSLNTQLPNYIKNIEGKIPQEGVDEIYDFVYENLPLFLSKKDYSKIENRLSDSAISRQIKQDYRSIVSPTGLVTKKFIFKDPLNLAPLGLNKLKELQVGDNYVLYNNYIVTKDKKHLLLFISPELPASETNKNRIFVEKLEHIQQQLNQDFKDVKGDFFGGVLYSLANANQIKSDVKITVSIAISILLILLIFFYRKIYVPLILFIPGVLAAFTSVAILYFIKGSISAISIGIGSILLGITLDYGLHILTHYRNNRDIKQLYKEVATPVLMSSFTTSIAFLCLLFVQSDALNDLGLFAAISVVVAALLALLIIPLLYNNTDEGDSNSTFLDTVAAVNFYRIKPLLFTVVGLFVLGLFFFSDVQFNHDLSEINFQPESIKKSEQKIQQVANSSGKSIYLVSYGGTIDEALQHNSNVYNRLKEFKDTTILNSYSSIGGVVLSTQMQQEKIANWKDFWAKQDTVALRSKIVRESHEYGFKPQSFNRFYALIQRDFKTLQLQDYQNTTNLYLNDFISNSDDFATVTTTINLDTTSVSEFLAPFKDLKGTVVIDRKRLNESFLGNLKNNFNTLIGLSIIAVFVVLFLFYRNLEISLLTLLPIAVTWVIALGIMAVLQIHFNILNIIISTFIFGLGLDYSIFITNACLKEYQTGQSELKTYQTSILISVITTLLGVGALIFAKHPALQSISVVSIIGILAAVLVAFVFQVWLFNLLFINRRKQGLPPFRFRHIRSFIQNKIYYSKDLYYHDAVLDNYRYKPVYKDAKHLFETNKERYLRVSNFVERGESLFFFHSGMGVLPIYLSYINPESKIAGFEITNDREVANNCFRSKHERLHFTSNLEEAANYSTFVLPKIDKEEVQDSIKKIIEQFAKKVIIVQENLDTKWLLDLDFEIVYRQNGIFVFEKK